MTPVLLFGTPFSRSKTILGKSLDYMYVYESTYLNGITAYESSVIALCSDGDFHSYQLKRAVALREFEREDLIDRILLTDGRYWDA